jgi:hypothetical protein
MQMLAALFCCARQQNGRKTFHKDPIKIPFSLLEANNLVVSRQFSGRLVEMKRCFW